MSTHWKNLANQEYIGAYALQPGEDITVTIKAVSKKEVIGTGGKKKECIVATLAAPHKPFVLNTTNAKTIQRLYGPYIEEWAGKSITLYADTTSLAGETVECLRIRKTPPRKQTITDERLDKALTAVRAGSYSVQSILEKFDLTPEQTVKAHESANQKRLEPPVEN